MMMVLYDNNNDDDADVANFDCNDGNKDNNVNDNDDDDDACVNHAAHRRRINYNCSSIARSNQITACVAVGDQNNSCAPREQQQPDASVSKIYCVYCVERRQQPFTSHWHSSFGRDTRTAE
jgi:hypothetical protein